MRFIQVALAVDPENGEVLYALGDDGRIYERAWGVYSPGSKYHGRSITRGRATTPPFWREVNLPFTEPELIDRELRRLEFEKEENENHS